METAELTRSPSGLALKIAPGDFVVSARKYRAHDYMDNGMDPLHFITGLIRAKMEIENYHLTKAEWIDYEDYNNWP